MSPPPAIAARTGNRVPWRGHQVTRAVANAGLNLPERFSAVGTTRRNDWLRCTPTLFGTRGAEAGRSDLESEMKDWQVLARMILVAC
jgi:hypothetical protein